MVKARIEKDSNGIHRTFVQRAKFKHWFELGSHTPTDKSFEKALSDNTVQWQRGIVEHDCLFRNLIR